MNFYLVCPELEFTLELPFSPWAGSRSLCRCVECKKRKGKQEALSTAWQKSSQSSSPANGLGHQAAHGCTDGICDFALRTVGHSTACSNTSIAGIDADLLGGSQSAPWPTQLIKALPAEAVDKPGQNLLAKRPYGLQLAEFHGVAAPVVSNNTNGPTFPSCRHGTGCSKGPSSPQRQRGRIACPKPFRYHCNSGSRRRLGVGLPGDGRRATAENSGAGRASAHSDQPQLIP